MIRMRAFAGLASSFAVAAGLAGCAYPTRNAMVDEIRPDGSPIGYRWDNINRGTWDDTLVVVTASGGGTRAAALELAVLRGLDQVAAPNGQPLTNEIDVISSVSGGSVTAAYFALKGRDGFDALYDDFIRQDGMKPLYWGLNPVSLARLSTPGRERIDLLIDYLNQQLFHDLTYAALLDGKPHPLLILNAADMVEGVPFPFTQRKFDLLCSDLSQLPLATAVAASAAFPIALSPVTLTNHTPCPATEAQEAAGQWPPAWVTLPLKSETGFYENDQMRLTLARVENAYARGAESGAPGGVPLKKYVHLLDGGIADNLGVFEPYRMLTTQDTDPQLLPAIDAGAVKHLIFVVINARSFAPNALDEQAATPGAIDMALASINAPIDRATGGTAIQLRTLLNERFRELPGNPIADHTALISVDFDAIHDEGCRRRFQSIATNWHLEEDELAAIDLVGKALLQQDPNWAKLLEIAQMSPPPDLPDIGEACAAIAAVQDKSKV